MVKQWDIVKIMAVLTSTFTRGVYAAVDFEIEHKAVEGLCAAQTCIMGEYDEEEDKIYLYVLSEALSTKLTKAQWEELKYQAIKTYLHELVHHEQAMAGEETSLEIDLSRAEYLSNITEVEAYARVDIPNDISRYGVSIELQEYAELLTDPDSTIGVSKLDEVYECLCYFDTPIDNYINDDRRYIQ